MNRKGRNWLVFLILLAVVVIIIVAVKRKGAGEEIELVEYAQITVSPRP
jgi:hypothetical protein